MGLKAQQGSHVSQAQLVVFWGQGLSLKCENPPLPQPRAQHICCTQPLPAPTLQGQAETQRGETQPRKCQWHGIRGNVKGRLWKGERPETSRTAWENTFREEEVGHAAPHTWKFWFSKECKHCLGVLLNLRSWNTKIPELCSLNTFPLICLSLFLPCAGNICRIIVQFSWVPCLGKWKLNRTGSKPLSLHKNKKDHKARSQGETASSAVLIVRSNPISPGAQVHQCHFHSLISIAPPLCEADTLLISSLRLCTTTLYRLPAFHVRIFFPP